MKEEEDRNLGRNRQNRTKGKIGGYLGYGWSRDRPLYVILVILSSDTL